MWSLWNHLQVCHRRSPFAQRSPQGPKSITDTAWATCMQVGGLGGLR